MQAAELEQAAQVAARAADLARKETLSRFRSVDVEIKADGSPVTEADRASERCIREVLRGAYPDFGMLGEEYGFEAGGGDSAAESWQGSSRPVWVIDPIDGTIAYSRGLPLYSTLIALLVEGEPVLGLIDLPSLDERYLGWVGSGCTRNGSTVQVSRETELSRALVSVSDRFCFDRSQQRPAFDALMDKAGIPRGYTDAFGHAQVLGGGVDAMVDVGLNIWDAAASQILVTEAGGAWESRPDANGKLDVVLGSPALVAELAALLRSPGH